LNFIAFHSAFPWEAELAGHAKAAKVKNVYAELGTLARMMRSDPARYAVLIGNLLDGFGADHILWGTDNPVIGPPHWQIEAFQTFTIPEQLGAQHRHPQLTPRVKNQIFGENAARIFGIDIAAAREAIRGDLLYKLRDDRNPLPEGASALWSTADLGGCASRGRPGSWGVALSIQTSDRDSQQRVNLTAVEHDRLAGEFPTAGVASDPIDIAAGTEDRHLAILHRTHDEEIRGHIERSRSARPFCRHGFARWSIYRL
jgi:Amidohydrolase